MYSNSSASSDPPSTQRRHPHLGLPLSLRRAPATRKPSTPHLSVVFADPSLSHGGAAPSRPGSLASEDALARQMNAGGQEIGLRSRRSSSATVRTVRTLSGAGSPSPGVEEEPEAGPSTPRRDVREIFEEPVKGFAESEQGTGDERGLETARKLNPKQSSSWLRWNAPSGFPRSRTGSMVARDKGKGRALESDLPPAASILAESISDDPQRDGQLPAPISTTPISDSYTTSAAALEPPPAVPPPPDPPNTNVAAEPTPSSPPNTVRPATRTYRRNWWSRTASPTPSIRPPIPSHAQDAAVHPAPPVDPVTPSADPSIPTSETLATHAVETPAAEARPTEPIVKSPSPAPQPVAPATSGRWTSYIWGNPAAPPLPPGESASSDNTVSLVPEPILDSQQKAVVDIGANENAASTSQSDTSTNFTSIPAPKPSSLATEEIDTNQFPPIADPTAPPSQGIGWGTFLFSLVAPQIAVARSLESTSSLSHQPGANPSDPAPVSSTNVPVNPAEDQRPAPESKPPISGLPTSSLQVSPLSTHSDTLIVPSDIPDLNPNSALRKASTSSTTGWLSYLAYRSTQKKITSGSVQSGRNSSELGEEEVMDLSADPDFPPGETTEVKKADTAVGTLGDKGKMPPPKAIPNKTSSANLAVRGKRQSISSVRSAGAGGGTLTPLSSSPKAGSLLDSKPTPSASPRPSSVISSALPPPPLVPTQQPNLVIPTFDSTFLRPPRSFLPLPPPMPEPSPDSSTTSALAWRALSAAGSYVYAGTAEKGKAKEKPDDVEERKETRGRKEGRSVGGDLPRRIGLGGGEPDEGWRGVKRVVVVGVHGWFPAKMLNSVIGEPTGTSQKFANMMGAAVKQFFTDHGMEDEIRLTLMPLEGEGTIDARVDKLYKAYLSNPAWINDLRRADAILFAAHSQGCIVTTHLLSRMIAQGHIRTPYNADAVARCEWAFGPIGVVPPDSRRRSPLSPVRTNSNSPLAGSEGGYQKVCMLAMCGVHLGPLYSISTSNVIQPYLQWFENAAARELFEFQESGSAVSLAYQKALGMVLENGVKVVLLASLNDQVVPIYGSSFSTATHPLLLRALFVDGASYSQTDFMTNLLCFAFMLRNAGLDDQRLIEHLSEATAGSLTGHSTPYEEPQSYALAVKYLFLAGPALPLASSASGPPTAPTHAPGIPPLRVEPFSARDTRNEFELPWIMRALVDSPQVKDLFPGELRDLKEGVGSWRPVTKVLKEVKRRLEPMAGRQSKLRPIPNSPSSASVNTVGSVGSINGEAALRGLKRDW